MNIWDDLCAAGIIDHDTHTEGIDQVIPWCGPDADGAEDEEEEDSEDEELSLPPREP